MSVTIPQIRDKLHRVCSYCKFRKVKCNGGDPCSTCVKDGQICRVWAPAEIKTGSMVRQGTINTWLMAQSMLHQALVDIIQSGKVPNVPAEALTSPHALLSAMGMINEDENASWKRNLEQPWAQAAFHLSETHPCEKKPHAKRQPKDTGKGVNVTDQPPAKRQCRQTTSRQPEPSYAAFTAMQAPVLDPGSHQVPAASAWQDFTAMQAPVLDPGSHQVPAASAWQDFTAMQAPVLDPGSHQVPAASAWQDFGSYQGQASFPVGNTFNMPPAAALPPAPGPLSSQQYNQGTQFFSSTYPTLGDQSYGQFPVDANTYLPPAPAQWQPAHVVQTTNSISPEIPSDDSLDQLFNNREAMDEFLQGPLVTDGDQQAAVPGGTGLDGGQAQYSGPWEGLDTFDFEVATVLEKWLAEHADDVPPL